uniref:large ribosomal subunit protein uL22 n=1 Tax=Clavibacter michiganensis TaxID=28447 RepID=UPI002930C4E2
RCNAVTDAVPNQRVNATASSSFLAQQDLHIAKHAVADAPTHKRLHPRAQGRAFRINKRTSHITVVLATPDEADVATPTKKASK